MKTYADVRCNINPKVHLILDGTSLLYIYLYVETLKNICITLHLNLSSLQGGPVPFHKHFIIINFKYIQCCEIVLLP